MVVAEHKEEDEGPESVANYVCVQQPDAGGTQAHVGVVAPRDMEEDDKEEVIAAENETNRAFWDALVGDPGAE